MLFVRVWMDTVKRISYWGKRKQIMICKQTKQLKAFKNSYCEMHDSRCFEIFALRSQKLASAHAGPQHKHHFTVEHCFLFFKTF